MVEAGEHLETAHDHTAKEKLLLGIARATQGTYVDPTKLGGESHVGKSEADFGIADTRARLGDAYPHLSPQQDAAVVLTFAALYKKPCHHMHGDSPAHHHHGGTSCSKGGPIHGFVRKIEQKILSAIGGKKGHRIAAIVLRGGALLFCPGDDIAAIGLQIYGSISGQGEHSHHTEQAIMPPRIVLQRTVVWRRTPLRS